MKLSYDQVRHIAWLARLGLSEADTEKFSVQLSNILENFEILKEVNTANIPPAAQTVALQNVFREDKISKSYPLAEVLAIAPVVEVKCFRVRAILE